jgi:RHS repeat-associated protein
VYNKNQVVQEYINDSLTPSMSYIYSDKIDDPIAFVKNKQRYYYIKDQRGSIRAISNEVGIIVESYSYNAFGIMTIKDQAGHVLLKSNYDNTYTYTGRRYDEESGLYYYRNRMYSAQLGRFLSKDPKGFIDGYNLYAYVKNNPLKYVDPFGTTSRSTNFEDSDQETAYYNSQSDGYYESQSYEQSRENEWNNSIDSSYYDSSNNNDDISDYQNWRSDNYGSDSGGYDDRGTEHEEPRASNSSEESGSSGSRQSTAQKVGTVVDVATDIIVPGKAATKDMFGAYEKGNYFTAGFHGLLAVGEVGLTVATFGAGGVAMASYRASKAAYRASQASKVSLRKGIGDGRTHITYQGVKNNKPYIGYASMKGTNRTFDKVLEYRYGNNFSQFSKKPQLRYIGVNQSGKDTARGVEQRIFEQKGGRQGTSNSQNPVGKNNKNRQYYLNAADKYLEQ